MKLKKRFALCILSCSLAALAACSSGSGSAPQSFALPGTGSASIVNPGNSSSGSGGSGTAVLAWTSPTANTNGTVLTDLAGFKVSYGTVSGQYAETVDVGRVAGCTVSNLGPGTWYFSVTAYNSTGAESAPSPEVSKTI